jgi:hypothetical protein
MAREAPPFHEWARENLAAYFPVAESRFHRWLASELGSLHTRRASRINILAPRGAAKSTWSTFAYPLWCALYGIEPYIILTSDTGEQAHKYLDSIRAELETNEQLASIHPHLACVGPVWREDRIRLANDVMIEAFGTGTKLRGRKNRQHRPSLIVVDDPQNAGHILSVLQRERSWEWLTKDVAHAGSPTTNIVVLGTALHNDCIVCKLQRTPGWRSEMFQAVEEWPLRMDLWARWEEILHAWEDDRREEHALAFYRANEAAMNE